jgi:hypothetical protein
MFAHAIYEQVFLKKLFYTPAEIDEFIRIADTDGNGEVGGTRRSTLRAPSSALTMRRQVTFEEFWALKSKGPHKRRQREVTITVVKAENVLNAGLPSHDSRPMRACILRPSAS